MKQHAFTIIELLVVIAIIGVLTVIGINSYGKAKIRARDVTRKSQVVTMQSALEQYKSVNNVYALEYATAAGVAGGLTAACAAGGQLGGCYVVSDDNGDTRDPLFVRDPAASATYNFTGTMLNFMDRPKVVAGSISDPASQGEVFPWTGKLGCSAVPENIPLTTGRIGYAVYTGAAASPGYWIFTVLENASEPRNPNGPTCYLPTTANIEFHDMVFPALAGYNSCVGTQYKKFARGSLGIVPN